MRKRLTPMHAILHGCHHFKSLVVIPAICAFAFESFQDEYSRKDEDSAPAVLFWVKIEKAGLHYESISDSGTTLKPPKATAKCEEESGNSQSKLFSDCTRNLPGATPLSQEDNFQPDVPSSETSLRSIPFWGPIPDRPMPDRPIPNHQLLIRSPARSLPLDKPIKNNRKLTR